MNPGFNVHLGKEMCKSKEEISTYGNKDCSYNVLVKMTIT